MLGGETDFINSFIAIKPDGVQVRDQEQEYPPKTPH